MANNKKKEFAFSQIELVLIVTGLEYICISLEKLIKANELAGQVDAAMVVRKEFKKLVDLRDNLKIEIDF